MQIINAEKEFISYIKLMETKFQILPAINIILECGLLFWEASITYTKTLKSKKFLNNSNE
jgi:hypothetical protein